MTTDVFKAAVAVAREVGYRNVTRKLLAEKLAAESRFGGSVKVAENFLVNEGKMKEVVDQLVEAKDRLALVPGKRVPTLSNLWKEHDKADILDTAYRRANSDGLFSFSLAEIAKLTGFSAGTLRNYFGSIDGLREQVVGKAIEHDNATLVMQGLALGVEAAQNAPDKLKRAAAKALA